MKIYYKMNSILLVLMLLLISMMVVPPISNAAQPTVGMGTTSDFAILAGSTITNTGTSTIEGSIGLHPGTAFTGEASATVSGETHINNAEALLAKDDLITAYNDAAGRQNATTIPSELGGTTLTPGTYNSADGTFHITGELTLDGEGDTNAVFIFQTDSTLITESGSNINLINSTRYCQVFWQVGSSATLGTNSSFKGNVLAMQSITATTGAEIEGKLFAQAGAVTLDSNIITNPICTETPPEETPPAETPPGETPPGETPPGETPPEETPPGETPPGETPSGETPSGETPSGETPSGETPSGETPAGETTPNVNVNEETSTNAPITETVTGGQLPDTSLGLYKNFSIGAGFILIGAIGWKNRKRYE